MKKLLLTLFFSFQLLALCSLANAQSIQPPKSMANKAPVPAASPNIATSPASPPLISAQSVNSAQLQTQPNTEAQGYSLAFLAYHYNEFCKLGLGKPTIDNLANQLKDAESQNQISQETIDKNVADTKRIYQQDPVKFCSDARQVASVIKQLFAGQPEGREQIPEPIKQMYLNQTK